MHFHGAAEGEKNFSRGHLWMRLRVTFDRQPSREAQCVLELIRVDSGENVSMDGGARLSGAKREGVQSNANQQ